MSKELEREIEDIVNSILESGLLGKDAWRFVKSLTAIVEREVLKERIRQMNWFKQHINFKDDFATWFIVCSEVDKLQSQLKGGNDEV